MKPERLTQLAGSSTRLTFQIADRSANPCALALAPDGDLELRTHYATRESLLVKRRATVIGADIVAIAIVRDGRTGTPAVAIGFNGNGARRLAEASTENAGQSIGIILNYEVIEAAVMREPIPDGAMLLSGGLTLEQANDLAKLLLAGTLPAPLTIIEQDIVQPR
jgi:preprotein translocase subunit SecD